MSQIKFEIVREGMGGFLNPPNDAEHTFSLVAKRRGREIAAYSLREALKANEVPEDVKERIRALLDEHKPVFTEEWEHSVYNYFRNCYSPDGINRNVSDCIVDPENRQPKEHHLAYLFIKQFFPDYQPNEYLILNNGDKGAWSRKGY